ncbi:MAG: hypothetical protein MAG453_00342 [Calditrichaeota bacterium]|nr:hypothetical protein [Calditrichota bacterium]
MQETTAAPQPQSGGDVELIKSLSIPLYQAKGWLKLVGIFSIINGILIIFSLWGILICWLPIWMGVLLTKSAGLIERAQLSGDRSDFTQAMDKLKTYFTIQGVFLLIVIVVTVVGIIILSTGASLFNQFG